MKQNVGFEDFIIQKEQKQWNIHGIEIVRNGENVMSYGDISGRYPIYSATKTITSIAAGIAVSGNKFSIDESLYEYLKGIIPITVSTRKTEQMKRISIKRLLTMSIKGFDFRPAGDDWLEFSINNIPDSITEEVFEYSNIPAYFVALSLQRAVSEHLMDYLKPRLFEPLMMEIPIFANCPMGYFYGASGMQMSVSELSKIGQMLLGGGIFNGCVILPKKWVEESTGIRINNKEGGYGYFIWRFKNGFMISGKWGQKSLILPDKGMCITYLSDMEHGSNEVLQAVENIII